MDPIPAIMPEDCASAYLKNVYGISRTKRTLQKLRCVGGGPKFRRIGIRGVGYEKAALDEWAYQLLSPPIQSTSDPELLRHQTELTNAAA